MRLYGLTGGIGAGKSEAARLLAARGVPVLDADRIGHEVLLPGGPAFSPVVAAFGPEILGPDGAVDRDRLARVVFADPDALRRLNEITHPEIFREIARRAAAFAADGAEVCVVEAALLGEDGRMPPMLSGLILVSAPVALRVQRLAAARGMAEDEARRRIAAQSDPESKRALAVRVLDNSGDLEHLQQQTDRLAEELLAGPL
jgi:dephospho-CoA kinase